MLAVQGLAPLLGGRVLELAGSRAPASFAEAVRTETAAAAGAGALLELATLRVASALEAEGMPNVPLKGPLLARALHGDAAMRVSRDIDVLVAHADLWPAARALAPMGWRAREGDGDPVLHLVLAHEEALPEVELHWRMHWYEAQFGARALARAHAGPTACATSTRSTRRRACCCITPATASPGFAIRSTPPPGGTLTAIRTGHRCWRRSPMRTRASYGPSGRARPCSTGSSACRPGG